MNDRTYALISIDMRNDFVLPGAPACVAGAHATVPCIRRLRESSTPSEPETYRWTKIPLTRSPVHTVALKPSRP